jgi:hypothetical protein
MTKWYRVVNIRAGVSYGLGTARCWTEMAPNLAVLERGVVVVTSLGAEDTLDLLTSWTLEYRYPNSDWAIWSKRVGG